MSNNKKRKKTVFAEGKPVVTTSSPYEKLGTADFELEYEITDSQNFKKPTSEASDKRLRLQCINCAIESGAKDPERIMDLATLFWGFVKSGE